MSDIPVPAHIPAVSPDAYRWPVAVPHNRAQHAAALKRARLFRLAGDRDNAARALISAAYWRFWVLDSKTGNFPAQVWQLPEISSLAHRSPRFHPSPYRSRP